MATDAIIGYFGIIVPKRHYWQGCFLNSNFTAEAQGLLVKIRESGLGDLMAATAVIEPVAGVSAAEQSMVGTLCATLVEAAVSNNEGLIGPLSMALHLVTGFRYFIIKADITDGGTNSKLVNLKYASSADDVRAEMEGDPDVVRSKVALLQRERARHGIKLH